MRLRHLVAALLAACGSTVALAPVASGAARGGGWQRVAAAGDDGVGGGAVGDGARYVAFQPTASTLRVIDALHPRRRIETRIHARCASGTFVDVTLAAVGGGQVLVTCIGSPPGHPREIGDYPSVFTIATGRWHDVPGDLAWVRTYDADAIGSRWIEGLDPDNPASWIDWRTGATRTDDGTPRDTVDLDAPGLTRPLCAPLRRPLAEVGGTARFGSYRYDDGFGVGDVREASPLTIQRCGQAEPTVIDPAGVLDTMAQLGSGAVTWPDGGLTAVWAYLPRCDARLRWGIPDAAIAHTSRSVYVAAGGELRRLDLPAGCAGLTRQLTVRAAGNRVAPRASAGSWPSARLGGARVEVLRMGVRADVRLALPRGTAVALRADAPARTVRWRLGRGAWRSARRAGAGGARWSLVAPRLPNPATLTVAVAYAAGGHARFTLRAHR